MEFLDVDPSSRPRHGHAAISGCITFSVGNLEEDHFKDLCEDEKVLLRQT
jgi:hypothetical protein